MILFRLVLASILAISLIGPVLAVELSQEEKEAAAQKIEEAIEAAQLWVSIVDSERYMDSWDQAAEFFKNKIPDGQWETTMQQVRRPFGKILTREVSNYQYLTHAPGSPAGEYVVIQFKTSFEKKTDAMETITPMRESDGQWRVSGYSIK